MKILVVEDERLISLALSKMIGSFGHEVSACLPSAEQALDFLERERPDFVLMDIRLEGAMDGIEAAGIIRERWALPLAFTSAYTDKATVERAQETKPYAFVAKPLSPERLKGLLEDFQASRTVLA